MKSIILKKQNGFAASDALIAVLIITLFTGIIATITYNIYLSNASLKRMSKANSYIVDIFEYVDKTYYDDVTAANLKNKYLYLQDSTIQIAEEENLERLGILEGTQENDSYNIKIVIDKYIPTNIEVPLDLVKQIRVIVSYKLGNKLQTIEMKRIKSREKNLTTPNKPDLSLITGILEGNKAYPIKLVRNNYIVCEENDSNWYDYENNFYARAGIGLNGLNIGDIFDETNNTVYQWIPRYGENQLDIKYYYSNSNKYIEKDLSGLYNLLIDGDINGYILYSEFQDGQTGIWETVI